MKPNKKIFNKEDKEMLLFSILSVLMTIFVSVPMMLSDKILYNIIGFVTLSITLIFTLPYFYFKYLDSEEGNGEIY